MGIAYIIHVKCNTTLLSSSLSSDKKKVFPEIEKRNGSSNKISVY